jgi:putative ABC transport system substrate-binding protein
MSGQFLYRRREFIALLGSAAVSSPAVGAEQPKPVIGYLGVVPPSALASRMAAFREGLSETGYIDGQNVTIEHLWADRYDRVPALAADLVRRKVDLIAAGSLPGVLAAKSATSTIPIVFVSADPLAEGLVASLARPSGNLTGVSLMNIELTAKRLELLSELIPQASAISLLVNPNNASTERIVSEAHEAARVKGVQLSILKAGTEGEIDAAFDAVVQQQASALLVGNDSFFWGRREQFVALASRHAVPAIYAWPEAAMAGGLISYGTNIPAAYREAGIYAGRLLKGEKPADLPVMQPTTFELVVNLKTAKALGLTVPPSILGRADEVIE